MHKTELAAQVADIADLPAAKSSEIVSILFDEITNALARGEEVSLIGFGSFSVRSRAARSGRNPRTGETIQIAASRNVGFKPGKALKDAVNG